MSQRGPGSHPASRRTSISPTGNETASPTTAQYAAQPSSSDGRHNSPNVSYSNGAYQSQQIPPRTLGVHNILNPSDQRHMASEGGRPGSRPLSQAEALTPGASADTYGPPRPFYPPQPHSGQPVSRSHPGTPVGSALALGGPAAERPSPPPNYRLPALNNPRKILSPKLPRAASISHGPPRDHDLRQSPSIPAASPAKRPFEPEGTGEPRPHPPGLRHHPDMPLSTTSPMATSSRSISQPAMLRQPGGPHGPPPSAQPSVPPPMPSRDLSGRPPAFHSQPQYQHGPPPPRSFSVSGTVGEASSAWPDTARRSGMGAMAGEGQQAFMTLPGNDVPIPVEVDYSQASRKADEKRQRNAKASTRHRKKKKSMQEENTKQLQDLRDERQEMMLELDDLAQQRDFYRDERNRLRDIVARTPGISDHAAGPATPPARSLGSYAETSPMGRSMGVATPSGYASETSSAERPAQRRRVDERPEFSIPVYGTPSGGSAPPTLPPMHGQGYGVPSRPSSASSTASGDRLPPLRTMDGPPPPGHGPGPGQGRHEQDPMTGQWVPAQPRQYETGWATAPRNPQDPPQR